jgi:hypothetical protein
MYISAFKDTMDAEDLAPYRTNCSICELPRKDLKYLLARLNPQNSVKLDMERMKRG